jgi:SAM-dependent methyltransferase
VCRSIAQFIIRHAEAVTIWLWLCGQSLHPGLHHAQGAVTEPGCGTGRVTAYLDDLGLPVFGVDLSPQMVAVARQSNPGLRFEVGSKPPQ